VGAKVKLFFGSANFFAKFCLLLCIILF
jgi:hypothetical protein